MGRIQIITISVNLLFLCYVIWLIIKGKLREEYSFVWIACTAILIFFSFWRDGLTYMSELFGVYAPPNLVFTGAIFAIFIYLLQMSVVLSKLYAQNKQLAQELALMKQQMANKPISAKNTVHDENNNDLP